MLIQAILNFMDDLQLSLLSLFIVGIFLAMFGLVFVMAYAVSPVLFAALFGMFVLGPIAKWIYTLCTKKPEYGSYEALFDEAERNAKLKKRKEAASSQVDKQHY